MNKTAQQIINRLSLRTPQEESLEIFTDIIEMLSLKKNPDLAKERDAVNKAYPICTDFERQFPSICFALATGVGKTRLMGAFITYLVLQKKMKNFFVLAPNLTIYDKLIDDLSNPNNPKYVFKGIAEFVQNQPRIITGDNYNTGQRSAQYYKDEIFGTPININIFNISKINAEARSGQEPKIKRLSEYIGESYFEYLSHLPDLVLIMDESHHYRADRGMAVLNELNPVLGIELTATPQIQDGARKVKFRNVVYDYPLGAAMRDGYVKEPAVATRKDFNPDNYSDEELDLIKLEDGIRIHEAVKPLLDIYARDNDLPVVKPFVLVVAKDTTHSGKLMETILNPNFFNGYYADKVMEIHSNQRGEEKDENIRKLVSLEDSGNPIEIVIHVNMLKEGWDVTNLYTIIPLRRSASDTLTEQTIGRGLRLPYGKRTGVEAVDKLTIVSHDRFQEIIEEANKPDSIINTTHIIMIDDMDLPGKQEIVVSRSEFQEKIEQTIRDIRSSDVSEEEKQKRILLEGELPKAVCEVIHTSNIVSNPEDLKKKEIRDIVVANVRKNYADSLFQDDIAKQIYEVYERVAEYKITREIKIPRITVIPEGDFKAGFKDFNLDAANLNFQPVSEEIIQKILTRDEGFTILLNGRPGHQVRDMRDLIVNELISFNEVDYDLHAGLLYKLAEQAIAKFKTYLSEEDAENVAIYHKREIARYIYSQLRSHFYLEAKGFEVQVYQSYSAIQQHNLSKIEADRFYNYGDTVEPASKIRSCIFTGFKKSCHESLKFDSKAEKDFAIILEDEANSPVLKWLRPAPHQFNILWGMLNQSEYEPDFIAETKTAVFMVEIKAEKDIENKDVQEKAQAALLYCRNATDYNKQHSDKPWKYVLIPHDRVLLQTGFRSLMKEFKVSEK